MNMFRGWESYHHLMEIIAVMSIGSYSEFKDYQNEGYSNIIVKVLIDFIQIQQTYGKSFQSISGKVN